MTIPEKKYTIVKEAEAKVDEIFQHFKEGELSEEERYNCVISIWDKATNAVTKEMLGSFNRYNPIKMMSDSGARGNTNQIKQLAGMRGNMADTSGRTIEIPIKQNVASNI